MRRSRLEILLLALLAYVPLLAAAPGRVLADTKLGLTVDPGRLVSDALWTWDGRQLGGWVPHQQVGYLWPSGPWFWLLDQLGVPDWLAQRLWAGTIILAAGLGMRWCARLLGLAPAAALLAAVVYQCTPYVLPYVSRTSVLLPPWAGLGWLVGLTAVACRTPLSTPRWQRWWPVAAFALVIATIGGINATAMLMIAPAPLLYLAHSAHSREITWRRAGVLTAGIGAASLAVSLWWLSGLAVQGRYGAQALAYSEALESTAFTSSAPEVLRGLGYWLFYVRDHVVALTTASTPHQEHVWVIGASWLLVLAGVAGLVLTRWSGRLFAATSLLVGTILAVGAYPVGDAAPMWQPLADNSRHTLVLALRSSTRATPMVLMALALGTGALMQALLRQSRRLGLSTIAATGIAVAVAFPALWSGGLADPALARDETMPTPWRDVAAEIDRTSEGRVLMLPGIESAAFRWGYTVDTPLAFLADTPVLTRDWLPLGSPGLMDVLYALDDRFQSGLVEPAALAPVARLLGADVVLVANDVQFERFDTARPDVTWSVYTAGVPGLGQPTTFGDGYSNTPDVPMVDEEALLRPVSAVMPQLALLPVLDPLSAARTAVRGVLVSGSGDGVVDAAAAGLLRGDEVLLLTAGLDDETLQHALDSADLVVVTDSNRARARHWRSSQDVWGFTEGGLDTLLLDDDPFDHRLPAFPDETAAHVTTMEQRGPVRATATAYGSPTRYWPEYRPAMAADGDLATSWLVGHEADPRGQRLQLTFDDVSSPIDELTLVQHQDPLADRWVRSVRLHLGDGSALDVDLDDTSRTAAGQLVRLPTATATVDVEITRVTSAAPRPAFEGAAVGFAEVATSVGPLTEVVRPPTDLRSDLDGSRPQAYVLSRLRADPTDRHRDDPERALVRELERDHLAAFIPEVTVRLSPRADDATLDALLGPGAALADRRMPGGGTVAGRSALDGDRSTAWLTPFDAAVGASALLPRDAPDRPLDRLVLHQRTADVATITEVRLAAAGEARTVPVPSPDAEGRSELRFEALPPGTVTLTITATDGATTIDRGTGRSIGLPTSVVEVEGDGLRVVAPPDIVDLGCRDDLLEVGGRRVPLTIRAPFAELVRGDPVIARPCGDEALQVELPPGTTLVSSAPGALTGLDVDRVVLHPIEPVVTTAAAPLAIDAGHSSRWLAVPPCDDWCWVVQGEGWSEGWAARLDGESIGTPLRTGAGMNGWLLPPSGTARTLHVSWTPQRLVWAGLILSLVAVLAALAVVVAGRRPAEQATGNPTEPVALADPLGVSATGRWWAAAAVTAIGVLAIQPAWGLAVGAVVLLARLTGRARLLGLVGVAVLALVGVYLVAGQARHGHPAGFGWPLQFDAGHRPTLAAVLLVAASALTAPRPDGRAG